MLEQDYNELMQEVRPDTALVEKMIEAQSQKKRGLFPKAMKVAAAVLCGLVVLALDHGLRADDVGEDDLAGLHLHLAHVAGQNGAVVLVVFIGSGKAHGAYSFI